MKLLSSWGYTINKNKWNTLLAFLLSRVAVIKWLSNIHYPSSTIHDPQSIQLLYGNFSKKQVNPSASKANRGVYWNQVLSTLGCLWLCSSVTRWPIIFLQDLIFRFLDTVGILGVQDFLIVKICVASIIKI